MCQETPWNERFLEQLEADPLAAVAAYYAQAFSGHERAQRFAQQRLGLTREAAAARQIGFSDRTLGTHIPSNRVRRGKRIRSRLTELGIYKPNGRETLRGYVTEPIVDSQGRVVGIRGHQLDRHAAGESVLLVGSDGGLQPATTPAGDAVEEHAALQAGPAEDGKLKAYRTADGKLKAYRTEEGKLKACGTGDGDLKACGTEEGKLKACGTGGGELRVEGGQLRFTRDDRQYTIGGLEKNTSACTLKVKLTASRDGLVHMDALDLVKARSRNSFIRAAADELYCDVETIKKDIGQLLLQLETRQAERIDALKKPAAAAVRLTEQDERDALQLLRAPDLLQRVDRDMQAAGTVGERTGRLAGYLAATSRLLPRPLAVVIQSSSSAGKSSLMDAILDMMPEESQMRVSKLTGKSLYYLDTADIQHKTLAISEEEGLREAAYALKLLQSEGVLRQATVQKGDAGRMVTRQHTVRGPVQIMLTTTAIDIDEELMNRALVLTVDESREQTRAIQQQQRAARTIQGHGRRVERQRLLRLHRNAQRLLRPLAVHNPYAAQLTFLADRTRLRRDHEKYLTLIDAIALLHQHQREVKTYLPPEPGAPEGRIQRQQAPHPSSHPPHPSSHPAGPIEFIEVTAADIALAGELAGEILGRSLDELAPQTRRLLMLVDRFVGDLQRQYSLPLEAVRFTRRDLREAIGWSDFQLHKHLTRLVDLEYLIVHRGSAGRRYVYELVYDGQGRDGQPFLPGLIDPSRLQPPAPLDSPATEGLPMAASAASDSGRGDP